MQPAQAKARRDALRLRAVQEVLVRHARQVDAARGAEVVPQVEARIDLEQVEAPGGGAALEIHLEDAREAELARNIAAEGDEIRVIRELEVGAVAGERGIGADLAADEPFEELAAGRSEAVQRPDRLVAAGHVFLEGELRRELCGKPVFEYLLSMREDARLTGAAEELQANARVVPRRARLRLDE